MQRNPPQPAGHGIQAGSKAFSGFLRGFALFTKDPLADPRYLGTMYPMTTTANTQTHKGENTMFRHSHRVVVLHTLRAPAISAGVVVECSFGVCSRASAVKSISQLQHLDVVSSRIEVIPPRDEEGGR